MKLTQFAVTLFLFAVTAATAGTIYWPVGSAGTQTTTRTLFNSFGNYHVGWETLMTPVYRCNFHMGIDIFPYNNNRDVRACKGGYISSITHDINGQYVVVVVDDTLNSTHGWSYQHLDDPAQYGWGIKDSIAVNDKIAEMSTYPDMNHTHFSWSQYSFNSDAGSDVNPLDSLYNATSLNWIWNRVFEMNPVGYDTLMFIPDMDHLNWPDNAGSFPSLLFDRNNLSGAVDILYGYCLEAIGSIGNALVVNTLNPDKIRPPDLWEFELKQKLIRIPLSACNHFVNQS